MANTGIGSGFGSLGNVGISVDLLTEQAIKKSNSLSAGLRNMSMGGVQSFKALQIQSQSTFKSMTGSLLGFRNLLIFGGLAFGLKSIVTSTAEFQSKLIDIGIISGNTARTFGDVRNRLLTLSSTLGLPLTEVAQGMRDIVSAQVPLNQGLDILEASSKLSVGSMTGMADATSALITLMQGYPGAFKNATDASDLLFAVQDRGRIEMKDLATTIGRIIPIAKTSGLSVNDLGSAIAMISRGIPNAEEAITALRGVINAIAKPSHEATVVAKQYGIELGTSAIAGGQFFYTLEAINKLAPDLRAKILQDLRAINGFGAIMTQFNEGSGADFLAMLDRTGKTSEAFKAQQLGLNNMMGRFTSTIRVMANDVGGALIPVLSILLTKFTSLVDNLKGERLSTIVTRFSTTFIILFENIAKIVGALLDLGRTLFGLGDSLEGVIDPFNVINKATNLLVGGINFLTESIKILKRELGSLPLLLGGITAIAGTIGIAGRAVGLGFGGGALLSVGIAPLIALSIAIGLIIDRFGGIQVVIDEINKLLPDATSKLAEFGKGLLGLTENITGLVLTKGVGEKSVQIKRLEAERRNINITLSTLQPSEGGLGNVPKDILNALIGFFGIPVLKTRGKFGTDEFAMQNRLKEIEEEIKSLQMSALHERREDIVRKATEEVERTLGGKTIIEFPQATRFNIFQQLTDVVNRGNTEAKLQAKLIFDQIAEGRKFDVETLSAKVREIHEKMIDAMEKAKFEQAFTIATPETIAKLEELTQSIEKLGGAVKAEDKALINSNLTTANASVLTSKLTEAYNEQANKLAGLRTRLEEIFPGINKFKTSLDNINILYKERDTVLGKELGIPEKLLAQRFKDIVSEIGAVSKSFENLTPDMKKQIEELANTLGVTMSEVKMRMSRGWQELNEFMKQAQRSTQQEVSNFLYNTLTGQITGAKEFFKSLWKSIIIKPFTEMLAGSISQMLFNTQLTGGGKLGFVPGLLGRLKLFGDGGVVRKPTLGVLGESGAEAVIPLNQIMSQNKEKPASLSDRPVVIVNLLDSEMMFRSGENASKDVIVNRVAENIVRRGIVFKALRGVA